MAYTYGNVRYKKMIVNNFSELQDSIQSYNSKSILEIGTLMCWQIFYSQQNRQDLHWVLYNAKRNSAIRIMLLASMGNSHLEENILLQDFEDFTYIFLNPKNQNILFQDAEKIVECINNWENNQEKVRSLLLKLSDIFDVQVIFQEIKHLFMQVMLHLGNVKLTNSLLPT
ncbi:hypothetical protein NIES4074_57460 [Cylindrospermum sp. NIES-4074]|nr:hypothetical protein NIES4074_57460 [Cylindrospermum sp. NIES-4074]